MEMKLIFSKKKQKKQLTGLAGDDEKEKAFLSEYRVRTNVLRSLFSTT